MQVVAHQNYIILYSLKKQVMYHILVQNFLVVKFLEVYSFADLKVVMLFL